MEIAEGRTETALSDLYRGWPRKRRSAGHRTAGPRAIGPRRVQFGVGGGVTVTASATPLPNRRPSTLDLGGPFRFEEVFELLTFGLVQLCLPLREHHVLCNDDLSIIRLATILII